MFSSGGNANLGKGISALAGCAEDGRSTEGSGYA